MRLTDEPKSLREMNPNVTWPPAIEAVMKRALQRKAGERYQKAEEFGNALMAAVESMPKQQQADMTMVMNTAAATAMLQQPPATRVDPNAGAAARRSAAAEAPVATAPAVVTAPTKSKMPLIAGGGALTAVAAVAVFFVMSKGGSPVAKPDSAASVPAAVTSPPLSAAANPGTSVPTVQQDAQGTQQTPTETRGASVTKATNGGTPPATAAVDITARIPDLIRQSQEDATAAQALKEATLLQPKAISASDNIGLSLVRANAHAMLGHDKQSCDIIDTIKERGATTVYAEKIALMVKTCAQ